ncbi:MAG: hypothetical protein GY751_15025 [Bacteroidetes bacterium]|nr:hypothetical protein [Bacteroidota bacterium]
MSIFFIIFFIIILLALIVAVYLLVDNNGSSIRQVSSGQYLSSTSSSSTTVATVADRNASGAAWEFITTNEQDVYLIYNISTDKFLSYPSSPVADSKVTLRVQSESGFSDRWKVVRTGIADIDYVLTPESDATLRMVATTTETTLKSGVTDNTSLYYIFR